MKISLPFSLTSYAYGNSRYSQKLFYQLISSIVTALNLVTLQRYFPPFRGTSSLFECCCPSLFYIHTRTNIGLDSPYNKTPALNIKKCRIKNGHISCVGLESLFTLKIVIFFYYLRYFCSVDRRSFLWWFSSCLKYY